MGRVGWVALLVLSGCFFKPDRAGGNQPPGGSTPFLVAGDNHACTIDGSGQLFCWGDNHQGQLLATTALYSASPVKIDGTWKEVAAGANHTCVMDKDGAVFCWGASLSGQSGQVGAVLDMTPIVFTDPTTRARHVYAGGDASCIVDTNSFLQCWGNYDPMTPASHNPTFVNPGSATGADQSWGMVTLSTTHICALNTDRTAWCWGTNKNLELGDTSLAAHSLADAYHITGTTFAMLAAADTGTCATTADGGLACWGDSQLTGTGSGSAPVTILDSHPIWNTIAAGGVHACGLDHNLNLDCWGMNDRGELGNNYMPKQSPGTVTLSKVTAVAAGQEFTCAEDDMGKIHCWGSDQFGQTGRGMSATQHAPFKVSLPDKAISVAAGLDHTCAALATTGEVYCWGDNDNGQAVPRGGLTIVTPTDSGHMLDTSNPTAPGNRLLSLGTKHTCVRKSPTALDCWGDMANMQLGPSGNGITLGELTSTGGTKILDFSAGGYATCASTDENPTQLYCWGTLADSTPQAPKASGNYTTVAAGYNHVLAASDTMVVGQLGSDLFCDNGSGSLVGTYTPTNAQQRQVFLAAGGGHGCALDNQGGPTTLVCWGDNSSHQVNPSNNPCVPPPTTWTAPGAAIVTIPNGVMWAQNQTHPQTVAAGGQHTCAIEEASGNVGTLYCWGSNYEAELGDGNDATLYVNAPHVASSKLWKEVTTGEFHTCGLDDSGDVYCWGLNQRGEVGNGDQFPAYAPSAQAITF
jgi:alpha-tubulin suppressor-like RCC1 family protein